MDEFTAWISSELKRNIFSATELSSAKFSTSETFPLPTGICADENCRLCKGERQYLPPADPKPEPTTEKLLDSVAEFMAGEVDRYGA